MNCRVCGIELTDDNHEHNRRLCRDCRCKQKKKAYQINRKYYISVARERYVIKHDEIRTYQKQYSKTLNGQEACRQRNRKHKTKRERGLDWISLNSEFMGSEGHHIDKYYVIFIPRSLHQSIKHNVFTGKNMDEINFLALYWYGLYYWMV